MEGIFSRKKTGGWIVLLCGMFFIAFYFFLNIVGEGAAPVFIAAGLLACGAGTVALRFNHRACLHAEETGIRAKFHWFGHLDCRMDEVEFVYPQVNTLHILLKNGKRYSIMGIENSWFVGSFLRRCIFSLETEAPDMLRQQLEQMQALRKQKFRPVIGCTVLLFANIFLTVLITGGRDLQDFQTSHWVIFSVMGVLELAVLVGMFYAAAQCGRDLLPIEQLRYRLRGAVIASAPLSSNRVISVHTDEHYTGRVVVCGLPNSESVYYCVEEFTGNFVLETAQTSEILDGLELLPDDGFDGLEDITSCFIL